MCPDGVKLAVPVGAAGAAEFERVGGFGDRGPGLAVVARMTGFHCVETVIEEFGELGAGAVPLEVRRRHDAADAVHEVRHLAQQRQLLVNERRATSPDVSVKRLLHGHDVTASEQCAGDVRASDRATLRDPADIVEVDPQPETGEAGHHCARAAIATFTSMHEEVFEAVVIDREEITEKVHLPQRTRTENSHAPITSTPTSRPVSIASATPAMVSWSVSASVRIPTSAAWRTTSAGARIPSDAVE